MNLLKISLERDNGISTLAAEQGVWLSVSVPDQPSEQELRRIFDAFLTLLRGEEKV